MAAPHAYTPTVHAHTPTCVYTTPEASFATTPNSPQLALPPEHDAAMGAATTGAAAWPWLLFKRAADDKTCHRRATTEASKQGRTMVTLAQVRPPPLPPAPPPQHMCKSEHQVGAVGAKRPEVTVELLRLTHAAARDGGRVVDGQRDWQHARCLNCIGFTE